MPIPPTFSDLGKTARDLLSKDYNFGSWKLNATTRSSSGVEFKVEGSQCHDTGASFGQLETKHGWKEHGLSISEKWNTDNVITTEVTLEDQLIKGLKLGVETGLSPVSDKKSAKLKFSLKNETIHAAVDTELTPAVGQQGGVFGSANTTAAAVVGYGGWIGGVQLGADVLRSKLTRNAFAIGFTGPDFIIHTFVNNCEEYGGSVHHKISPRLEAGVTLSWLQTSGRTRFAVGTKYQLEKDAHLKAKLTSESHLGLAFVQTLRPGIKLTLSTLIDGRNFAHGGHKVGLGFDMEA